MRDFKMFRDQHPTFKETYPHYELSELVRLGILISAWLPRQRGIPAGASRRPGSGYRRHDHPSGRPGSPQPGG